LKARACKITRAIVMRVCRQQTRAAVTRHIMWRRSARALFNGSLCTPALCTCWRVTDVARLELATSAGLHLLLELLQQHDEAGRGGGASEMRRKDARTCAEGGVACCTVWARPCRQRGPWRP
jgi:hypothetical protein